MANELFYRVYGAAVSVANGPVLAEGKVAIAGTSTQTATVIDPSAGAGNRARSVRLFANAACFVTWDENPTALINGSDGQPMGAENPEFVEIKANHKIACIARS
jgi:hypothetical protein